MKKTISLVAKVLLLCIICSTVLCSCSLTEEKRERPILGFYTDKSKELAVLKDGTNCAEFEQNASVKLTGNQFAYFHNFDIPSVRKIAISANITLPETGKSGIILGKYTDANGIEKTMKSVISVQDKTAYLVAFNNDSSEVLAEYQIKTDLANLLVITAEYDNGKIAFWLDEEYLYKKTFDLSTMSESFEFYAGFIAEKADVEFKFIKVFGSANTKEFDVNTIIENCTDLVPNTGKVLVNGDPKNIELGPDSMISTSGANRVNFTGLNLDPTKPIAYSFTLKTIKVKETWNGFRPTFLVDENNNAVKMFSLDGSISIFYYDAKTKKDVSKASNTGYKRPLKTEENFIVYCKGRQIYIFLEGQLVTQWMMPEANYTPVFTTLFEFGHEEVTNIKIYQANDVTVY